MPFDYVCKRNNRLINFPFLYLQRLLQTSLLSAKLSTMEPWTDRPFYLILLNALSRQQNPDALYISIEIANAHGSLVHALNSLYLLTSYVTAEPDVQDLLRLAIFWESCNKEHYLGG
jgi:hypothetical protein